MRLFGTWYWGFRPEIHPFAGFSTEGGRGRLLSLSKPGDRLVVVATLNRDRVAENERGRMLGMIEFGKATFKVDDYFPTEAFEKELLDDKGQFIWPHAVPVIRAWRFDEPPIINDVIGRNFSSAAISTVDEIEDSEARQILAVPHTEVQLAPLPARLAGQRLAKTVNAVALQQTASGQPGPAPSEWSAIVSRCDGPTATYLAQFGKHEAWKIGISQNPKARMTALNFSIPHQVTGCEWELRLLAKWNNGAEAYEMEQCILKQLSDLEPRNEQFCCTKKRIESAWSDYFAGRTVS